MEDVIAVMKSGMPDLVGGHLSTTSQLAGTGITHPPTGKKVEIKYNVLMWPGSNMVLG